MSIWNKILLGFIFLATLGFCYLGMRTLKTQDFWRSLAQKYEEKIKTTEKEIFDLEYANVDEDDQEAIKQIVAKDSEGKEILLGIKQLSHELAKLDIGRGRIWSYCGPQQVSPTGGIAVQTNEESSDGPVIAPKSIVHVFEERDVAEDGRYLGEFRVENATEQQVVMEPTRKLTPEEIKAIQDSQATPNMSWAIYEKMPVDSPETFAGMNEDQLTALLIKPNKNPPQPEVDEILLSRIDELVADGKPVGPESDAPAERFSSSEKTFLPDYVTLPDDIIDEVESDGTNYFFRPLRDYSALFEMYDRRRIELHDSNEATVRDGQLVQGALADAEKQKALRTREKAMLDQDRSQIERERDVVAKHQQELQRRVSLIQQDNERIKQTNKAMAGQLAKIQLSTARHINERTRRMVQSTPDGS